MTMRSQEAVEFYEHLREANPDVRLPSPDKVAHMTVEFSPSTLATVVLTLVGLEIPMPAETGR